MASLVASIDSLPNELLAGILSRFDTSDLPAVVRVSRHFHQVVARIIHRRLLHVASLPENELILECYHPSAKISTPYLSCRFLGLKATGDASPHASDAARASPELVDPRQLYSSFRPVVDEENRRRRLWFPLAISNSMVSSARDDEAATQDVFLDDGERFSQLCVGTNVVKEGPRRGLFLSHVNISDGVIRVFRDWLARMAANPFSSPASASTSPLSQEEIVLPSAVANEGDILWADSSRNIGLRFRVTMGPTERMPVLSGPDDEPPISYKLIYEELLVRTPVLLLAVEKSLVQQVVHSGKAVVIASV